MGLINEIADRKMLEKEQIFVVSVHFIDTVGGSYWVGLCTASGIILLESVE